MYVYGVCLFFMSVVVTLWGVCGNVCYVAAVVKDSGVLFRHAAVVCLCLVCILWQFSVMHSA